MNTRIDATIFDHFPELETERLRFRELVESDAAAFFKDRSDPEVMRYISRPLHRTEADTLELIQRTAALFRERKGINWVLESKLDAQWVGTAGFYRLNPEHVRAEVGYALRREQWGKGYMREALSELIRFGFERLQVHAIEANVHPDNQRSRGLLERVGFRQEAYFRESYLYNGQFEDSLIYCLLESDPWPAG